MVNMYHGGYFWNSHLKQVCSLHAFVQLKHVILFNPQPSQAMIIVHLVTDACASQKIELLS